MSDRFEDLTREMAGSMPRRKMLRFVGASVAAAAGAAFVRPFGAGGRAVGVVAGTCTSAGEQVCGPGCCPKGFACSSSTSSCGCCCRAGTTPCGDSCCAKGVACLDAANQICGCQPGTTPCGDPANLTCCDAGTACAPGCPPPQNNLAKSLCFCAPSDVNIKDNIVPVRWERG
jgi:hypothetical protein